MPTLQKCFESMFLNFTVQRKYIHTLPHTATLDSKLWCFQYKILHSTLHLNQKLFYFTNIILHFAHFVIQKMKRSFTLNDYGVYTVTKSFKTNIHITRPYSRLILQSTIECLPFCEKYEKLYFNAKHFEKGLNRTWEGGEGLLKHYFHKKCPFRPILNAVLHF